MDINSQKIKITTDLEKLNQIFNLILESEHPSQISNLDFDLAKQYLKNLYDSTIEYHHLKVNNIQFLKKAAEIIDVKENSTQKICNTIIAEDAKIEEVVITQTFETEILPENKIENEIEVVKNIEQEVQEQIIQNNTVSIENENINNNTILDEGVSPTINFVEPEFVEVLPIPEVVEVKPVPEVEQVISEPEVEQVISEPVVEQVISEPVFEQVKPTPVVEHVKPAPVVEQVISEPVVEQVKPAQIEKNLTKTEQVNTINNESPNISKVQIVSDRFTNNNSSIYDKLKSGNVDKSISKKLQNTPVLDLKKAIGINDRFSFINDLFDGKKDEYELFINQIIQATNVEELESLIENTYQSREWQHRASISKFTSILNRFMQSK